MTTLRRCALLGLATLLLAASARAQTQPPPATEPPPATPPPPGATDAPPAPPAPPPAGTAAPVAPLAPTMAPEPAQGPPLQLTERSPLEQQAPRPEPLYQKTWFWAACGVVLATAFVILFVTLRDKASEPPTTTFGNMHAF